jgi:hypothetical protein
MYCFIYFLVFGRCRLDAVDFDNLKDLEEQDFEQQAGEQSKCSWTMLNLYSFSL